MTLLITLINATLHICLIIISKVIYKYNQLQVTSVISIIGIVITRKASITKVSISIAELSIIPDIYLPINLYYFEMILKVIGLSKYL